KSRGAHVTGVCSTRNVELVRSLGADEVIDYTKADFTQGGQQYDLILDMVGNHALSDVRRVLNPTGKYIMIGGPSGRWVDPLPSVLAAMIMSRFVSQDMRFFLSNMNQKDLQDLSVLAHSGQMKPVIDRTYTFQEAKEALRYLETGRARG